MSRTACTLLTLSAVLLAALALAALSPAQAKTGKKHAVIIGINEYRHADLNDPKLEYAEQDAHALQAVLKASGYDVVLLPGKEATLTAIEKELKALAKKGGAGGVVLVALSGHGLQPDMDEEAYFYPWDAGKKVVKVGGKNKAEWDMDTLLPISKVLTYMKASPAGARALLVDACRNDPKSGRGRGVGAGLKTADLPNNTAVLLSCSKGERSWEDKKWKHGAFFYHLLQGMNDMPKRGEKVTALRLASHVQDTVPNDVEKIIGEGTPQRPYPLINGVVDLQIAPNEVLGREYTNEFGAMKLVRIPGTKETYKDKGTFTMGSPPDEKDREPFDKGNEEQHEVEVSPFHLGVHEVTQKQFRAVMGYNPSYFSKNAKGKEGVDYGSIKPGGGKEKSPAGDDMEDYPVENVSWDEAVAFCKELTKEDKKKPAGHEYRLPREAEWEYACRGGASSYQVFHFGNALSSTQANFDGNYPYGEAGKGDYLQRTCKVGTVGSNKYEKNGFGLYDMHGNVWEWCADWYGKDYYGKSEAKDPKGPAEGSDRVLRGGSWYGGGQGCRSALRGWHAPASRRSGLGFRVALVPSGR